MSMPRHDAGAIRICAARPPRAASLMSAIAGQLLINKMAPALRKVYVTRAGAALRHFDGRERRRFTTIRIPWSAAATASCRHDIYAGCPPTAGGALLYGVLLLQKKILSVGTIERYG